MSAPELTTNNAENLAEVEIKDTIVIHNDKAPVHHDWHDNLSINRSLLSNVSDGQVHDLKSFLQRPIVVARGSWATTDAFNAKLATINLPDDYLTIPIITNKVKGFLGFRGTAVVRLQLNTTRFQQGRLVLNFFPQSSLSPDKYNNQRLSALFYTQLPRVDFDASTDSEVTLRVPFINTNLFFNLRDGSGSMGTISLFVYSTLIAITGETSADYTIWVSFEDVQLEYPTIPSGFISQAGGISGATRKKTDVSNQEVEISTRGPISSIFSSLAQTADAFSAIPVLTSFAAPTSWFFSAASKAASAFGFSNPINTSPQCIVVQQPMSRSINSTGQDTSFNMGLFEDNAIELLPGFAGTNDDEMSLNHVLSIPTFIFLQTWADSVPSGDQLFFVDLTPSNLSITGINFQYDTNPAHVVATQYNTPIAYFSNLFAFYRGSIRLTFKIVKTEFHSGRLLIGFSPSFGTDPTSTNSDLDYTHREILDIRLSNEITMTFPYASTRPWLPVTQTYGKVYINVLNDLRAPSNVSPTLNILVEVSAAPDFEFSVPTALTQFPVSFTQNEAPPTSLSSLIETPSMTLASQTASDLNASHVVPPGTVFKAQVGMATPVQETGEVQQDFREAGIGTSAVVFDRMKSAAYCIGEKIYSLRQLVKRANPAYLLADAAWADLNPRINALPLTAVGYPPLYIPNIQTYIELTFAYARGSVRLRTYNHNYTTLTRVTASNAVGNSTIGVSQSGVYPQAACGYPIVPVIQNTYPFSEIQLPFYNETHTAYVMYNPSNTIGYGDYPLGRAVYFNSTTLNELVITRQYGDDYSAGFFTGTLPTIALTTTTFPSIARI